MIMENYPEYYFWDFYRANEDFEYTYRDVPPDKSECLIVGMKMNRNRVQNGVSSLLGSYDCSVNITA